MRAGIGLAGLALLWPAGLAAEEAAVDPGVWPYTAVGKLNVVLGAGRRSFCTATLIGPRLVLTAAHCLWDGPRARFVNPGAVHFLAGWAQGSYGAHAVAAAYRTAPDYVPGTAPASLAADWALVNLSAAVPVQPVPLAPAGPAEAGAEIRRAGYSRLRAERMSAQAGCTARLAGPPALLLHDCRAIPGQSGSALLAFGPSGPRVVGVLVAGREGEGAAGPSLAVPVETFRAEAARMLAEPAP